MKPSTKIILPIIIISALLILLNGCMGTVPDESPGFTPGTITGVIASPCCSTSDEPVSETCCIAPEFWCFYCQNTWDLQDGIKVVLTYGEDEVATTTTNKYGEFTFADVAPGKNYVVTAYCPDFGDNRPLVKDVALELIEGGSFDTKITDLVSTSLGLVVDFLVLYTEWGPEDISLDEVLADRANFPNFPKFKKLVYEVRRVVENCEVNLLTDDDVQDALCRAAEEISKLEIGCGPGYTPPPPPPPTLTYTVTFDSQGGSAVNSQTVAHGGKVSEPTNPTRTGYTFGGWYKESGCTNAWVFATDTVTANVTLYAKWTINSYTVTYNGNGSTGGTVPTDANNYEQGDSVTVLGNTGNLVKTQDGISLLFTGWNTAANGSGTSYNAADTFNMGNANVILYAQWSAITATGPAGGLIFYDKGSVSDGWRYLEAAPSDQSTGGAEWGCSGIIISGADGIVVGTGKQNTIDIEAGCATLGTAADICANLSLGAYNDWFLPSQDELSWMYTNLKVAGVGGFADDYYWSSSEYDAGSAWAQVFDDGAQYDGDKGDTNWVRAVRAFRSTEPTYLVNYNANGATGGTVPSDGYHYEPAGTVMVLHNTGNLVKTGYTFDGWNTQADGNGTNRAVGSTFILGAANETLYAKWTSQTTYSLRDVGPAGGLIFYINPNYVTDGWRYLEAAPSDQHYMGDYTVEWGCCGTIISGADGTAVGTGKQNTIDILNECATSGIAADICANLDLGGYDDWFLPSKDELNLMYENLKVFGVGGFLGKGCWSSSEVDADDAWLQYFLYGNQTNGYKSCAAFRVRAVRAF